MHELKQLRKEKKVNEENLQGPNNDRFSKNNVDPS